MRKRCGAPSHEPASSVSRLAPPPESVRAYRPPPADVLNMAHGAGSNVMPKPMCWNVAPLKVATNSSDRPTGYVAVGPARAPSTVSTPADTVAVPPGFHAIVDQSVGSAARKN